MPEMHFNIRISEGLKAHMVDHTYPGLRPDITRNHVICFDFFQNLIHLIDLATPMKDYFNSSSFKKGGTTDIHYRLA